MSEPISRVEFQNHREDTIRHLNELHDCDKRIEGKIDTVDKKIDKLVEKLDDKQTQKEGNSSKLKVSLIGSIIMGLSAVIVAVIAFFKPS